MTLINCMECGNEVSDIAPSCPNCGIPVAGQKETKAAGTKIHSIQKTSKKFKFQKVLSISIILLSLFLMLKVGPNIAVQLLFIIGGSWYLTIRLRIWWHHR